MQTHRNTLRTHFDTLFPYNFDSCLRLTIQDKELQNSSFGNLKQMVNHIPGISLAEIPIALHPK